MFDGRSPILHRGVAQVRVKSRSSKKNGSSALPNPLRKMKKFHLPNSSRTCCNVPIYTTRNKFRENFRHLYTYRIILGNVVVVIRKRIDSFYAVRADTCALCVAEAKKIYSLERERRKSVIWRQRGGDSGKRE